MQDWEVELVTEFLNVLYSHRTRQGDADGIWWMPSKRQKFEVRSFYQMLSSSTSSSFQWKTIWVDNVP